MNQMVKPGETLIFLLWEVVAVVMVAAAEVVTEAEAEVVEEKERRKVEIK